MSVKLALKQKKKKSRTWWRRRHYFDSRRDRTHKWTNRPKWFYMDSVRGEQKSCPLMPNQLEKCNCKTDSNPSIDSFFFFLLWPSVLNDVNWLVRSNLRKRLLKPFHCLPFHTAGAITPYFHFILPPSPRFHIFHARMTECWWGVSGQFQKSVRTALFSWKPADSWSVQRVVQGLWSPFVLSPEQPFRICMTFSQFDLKKKKKKVSGIILNVLEANSDCSSSST